MSLTKCDLKHIEAAAGVTGKQIPPRTKTPGPKRSQNIPPV